MKSDKLQDALGMIDPDLILRAEKQVKKSKTKRFIRWTAPIAAVLAIALAIGIIFGSGSPFILTTYAIAEAEYPKMAPYPTGIGLMGIGSGYDNWRKDQKERAVFFGQGKNMNGLIEATATEILSGSRGENVVYSPLNIYMALAMLAEITDGESRQQILTLLNTDSIDALRSEAYAVWNANYNDDGSVTSILASSLWLNKEIAFNKNTLNTLATNYYASSYQGKMGSSRLNQAYQTWLNEQTGGLLKKYVSDIELTPETIMALATTIYFEAKWDSEFSKSQTRPSVFHAENGDITTDFMHTSDTYGNYYWGEKFSATSKQLQNSGAVWFILPDEGFSIDDILADEEALSFLSSHDKWENHASLIVNLSVPKFDVSSKLNLAEKLQALGITDCFDEALADFTPLTTAEETVFLSEIQHGARVTMDEEGVTAVAYTEMRLAGSAAPPEDEIDFVVDRPFIFLITGEDGSVLFIGVVNQP